MQARCRLSRHWQSTSYPHLAKAAVRFRYILRPLPVIHLLTTAKSLNEPGGQVLLEVSSRYSRYDLWGRALIPRNRLPSTTREKNRILQL